MVIVNIIIPSQMHLLNFSTQILTRLPLHRHHRKEFLSPQLDLQKEVSWVSSSTLAGLVRRWGTLLQETQMMAASVRDYGPAEVVRQVDSFGPSLVEQQAEAALVVP